MKYDYGTRIILGYCKTCEKDHGAGYIKSDYTDVDDYYCVYLDEPECGENGHSHMTRVLVEEKLEASVTARNEGSLTLANMEKAWDELSNEETTLKGGEKEMQKFKEGDTIRMKESCSGCEAGETYELRYNPHDSEDDDLFAWNLQKDSGCHCEYRWEKVEPYTANKTMALYRELNAYQKEHWDEETKALYQTGIVDSDGNVASENRLLNALMKVNFKSLADNARKEVAEAEAEAKKQAKKQG